MANTTTKKTTATTTKETTTKATTAKKPATKKAPAKKTPAKKPETKGASMSKVEEAVAEFGKAMEDFALNKKEVPDIPAVTAPAAPEENPAPTPKKKGRPPKIDYPEEQSKAVTEQKLHTLNEKRYALYSLVNESLKHMIEAKYLCADMAKDKHKIISNKYAELYRRVDKLVDSIHDDVLQKAI